MIDRLQIYLNSLEKREKITLFLGLFLALIIVNVFFISIPLVEKIKKLDKKIQQEIQNYTELMELASRYISIKGKHVDVSLSAVERVASISNVKGNITSIKTVGNKDVELFLEDVKGENLANFIKKLNQRGFIIKSFSMDDVKGLKKYKVRIIISGR